jgi:predicted RNA-binding Zn ribbon-like protein
MAPPTPIHALKIVGGAVPVDFVNTVGSWAGGELRDVFVTVDDLIAWGKRVAILDAAEARKLNERAAEQPEQASRLLRDARKLRDLMHTVFAAVARGELPAGADTEALAVAAERALSRRRLRATAHGFTWGWANAGELSTILDRIAHAAAELLVDAERKPLKECPGPHCGWLFLDTSRNGKRRWCTEEDCGTQARVRAFRARQKR